MSSIFNRDFIKNILKDKQMNYNDLSKISGIPLPTLSHIFCNAIKNPRVDTIQAIYNALELNIDIKKYKRNQHKLTKYKKYIINYLIAQKN